MAQGWTVKFSQEPKLGLKDQVVSVPPEKLVLGVANAWSDPLFFPRTTRQWTKEEQSADVLERLAPRRRTPQEEAALASLRRQPNCAGCPLGTLPLDDYHRRPPRAGGDAALLPGGEGDNHPTHLPGGGYGASLRAAPQAEEMQAEII